MNLHENDDRREDIDAIMADGLFSLERGDVTYGGIYVAIAYSEGDAADNGDTYGFEMNGYGQRAYHVFESDADALAWFESLDVGPAF